MFQRLFFWPIFASVMGFALGGSFVWSQQAKPDHHQGRPQPAGNQSQQPTNKDAEANPRISAPAKTVGQQDAGHGEQESSSKNWSKIFLDHLPDWFVALFTAVLSIFTGLLWWSTDKLWKAGEKQIAAAQKAADAAMLSAKAAIGLELPLIQVTPDKLGAVSVSSGDELQVFYSVGAVRIGNRGRTRAFPLHIEWGWSLGDRLPDKPVYSGVSEFRNDVFFDPDKIMSKNLPDCTIQIPTGDGYAVDRGTKNLWFYCCFIYQDFMETSHEARFCWRRTNVGASMAWRPDATPAYNRKT